MLCKECLSWSFGYCYIQEVETNGEHPTCWVSDWVMKSTDDLLRRFPCYTPHRLRPLGMLHPTPPDKLGDSAFL
ncbi:MAG: hypothetical protein EPO21_17570 [Chloroflexota bacterium]|nr:MAG: hypothetical protein EPO21_17570 [Chloroflexota bacterium]